jgi:hypothetical protein
LGEVEGRGVMERDDPQPLWGTSMDSMIWAMRPMFSA